MDGVPLVQFQPLMAPGSPSWGIWHILSTYIHTVYDMAVGAGKPKEEFVKQSKKSGHLEPSGAVILEQEKEYGGNRSHIWQTHAHVCQGS